MDTWLEVEDWARLAPYQLPVATVATTEMARRSGRKRGSLRLKSLGAVEMVGDGGDARRAVEGRGGIMQVLCREIEDGMGQERRGIRFCISGSRGGGSGTERAGAWGLGIIGAGYCGEMRLCRM